MADAGGIRAGRAYVEIGANSAGLDAGLRAAQAKVKRFGEAVGAAGASLVKAGVAIGAPLAAAAYAFSGFETNMARLKAVLGDGATVDAMAALEAQARKMGLETAYSAREAAEGMVEFAIAGFKSKDILDAIHPTLDLAAAGMISVHDAAKISARVINDMGFSTAQLRPVLDVLGKAATSGGTGITELGEAFKFVGPVANIAGVNLTELVAAVQLLGKSGIEADMAGTGLRGMLLAMGAPTDEARKAFRSLGIEVKDAKGNFRGITPILADIEKATAGMGTGDLMEKLSKLIPSDRAMTAMAALLNKGSAALSKQTGVLGDADGTTAKIAAIQLDTLRGATMLLTSSLEGLGIVVGKAVAPVVRSLGESLMFATNAITAMAEKNPGLFETLAKVSVGLLAAGGALMGLGLAIKLAVVPLGVLAGAFGLIGGAVTLWLNPTFVALRWVATALYMIPGAAGAASAAWGELSAASAATAAAIVERWSGVWSGIADSLANGDLGTAFQVVLLGLKGEWMRFTGWLDGLWVDFCGHFVEGWASAVLLVSSKINDMITEFKGMYAWLTTSGEAYQAELKRIEREGVKREAALIQDANAEQAGRKAERDRRKGSTRAGIDANQAEIDALVGRAAAEKEMARIDAEIADLEKYLAEPGLGKNLPDVGAGMAEAGKVTSAGTFSAAAAFGLGSKSIGEKIASATERTADNTKKLLDQGGGLGVA